MKIKVTLKDIEEGYRGSCYECPIALAFKREVKPTSQIGLNVGAARILHREVHEWDTYTLPKKAQTFIKRFDGGKPVKPFTFEIEKDLK
jgi:hypothetical protein